MLSMDEGSFIDFYRNTVDEYSNYLKRLITVSLENEGRITFEEQIGLADKEECQYFSEKNINEIVRKTVSDRKFWDFYEKFDFMKMYKYSIPFFYEYEGDFETDINKLIEQKKLVNYEDYKYDTIALKFDEAIPMYYKTNEGDICIKFVFQKYYFKQDLTDAVNYRYVIIVYIDLQNHMIDIRYDSLKRYPEAKAVYSQNIDNVISWLKKNTSLKLFKCDSRDFLDVVNSSNEEVTIFKQMMDMGSSGQAELTASKDSDYILPFIGEIRELIAENEELFEGATEIRQLLEDYVAEKEFTASYPYVYLMWKRAVATKQFIVKVTFSYFDNNYIQLQHITGNCTDVGMERMNDAIRYFSSNRALIKGAEI